MHMSKNLYFWGLHANASPLLIFCFYLHKRCRVYPYTRQRQGWGWQMVWTMGWNQIVHQQPVAITPISIGHDPLVSIPPFFHCSWTTIKDPYFNCSRHRPGADVSQQLRHRSCCGYRRTSCEAADTGAETGPLGQLGKVGCDEWLDWLLLGGAVVVWWWLAPKFM